MSIEVEQYRRHLRAINAGHIDYSVIIILELLLLRRHGQFHRVGQGALLATEWTSHRPEVRARHKVCHEAHPTKNVCTPRDHGRFGDVIEANAAGWRLSP